jgi:NSS family neurotransmitter:Na+ symporter
MMPIAAAATCLLILKVTGIETIEQEVTSSSAFRRKKMYKAVMKYLSLVFLFIILISSVLDALGIIHI